MASLLARLKTFWTSNATLNSAVSVASVYFGYLPPVLAYPYVIVNVPESKGQYMTGGSHIERAKFTLRIYHTSSDTLNTLADSIEGQFDQLTTLDSSTILVTRLNRQPFVEVVNKQYIYSIQFDYAWMSNSTLD